MHPREHSIPMLAKLAQEPVRPATFQVQLFAQMVTEIQDAVEVVAG